MLYLITYRKNITWMRNSLTLTNMLLLIKNKNKFV